MLRSGQQLVERVERLPVEQIVGIHGEWRAPDRLTEASLCRRS